MQKKNSSLLMACAMFLVALLVSYTSIADAGRKHDIKYPAYMQGIDYGNGPVYVIGHKPPDSDSVCTVIAYANLKRKLGINAEPGIASPVNAETAYALKYFGLKEPSLLENAAGKNIILIDHNSFAQAAPGMDKANILEVIDHHNLIGDVTTASPAYYRNLPIGCASTIVWLEYLEANVPIEKPMAGMMLSAILSDTDNLQSNTATDLDRQAVSDLVKKAGIKDRNAYFLAMEEEFAAYRNMSEKDIFYSDYKEFTINGISYGCATVVALTPEKRQDLEKRLGDWVLKNFETQNMDMLFLKIHDLESYKATISCYGDGAVECAAAAFPKTDGNKILLEKNLSRKKVVRLLQPQIEKWATAHQQKDAA
ncbi:MAG: DHH family phosphoesterase [Schwartzia sp.]|nr:DHH family phosphoesterase [Schwartzia sp. (in: firmicutes)]